MWFLPSFNIFISFVRHLDYPLYFMIFRTNVLHQSNRPSRQPSTDYSQQKLSGMFAWERYMEGTCSLLYLTAARIQYNVLNIHSVRKMTRTLTTLMFYKSGIKTTATKAFFPFPTKCFFFFLTSLNTSSKSRCKVHENCQVAQVVQSRRVLLSHPF